MSPQEQTFVELQKVGHLAIADQLAHPHVVPVCFALTGGTLYVTIDEQPKRQTGRPLKRVRNIMENPGVAIVVDRYEGLPQSWGSAAAGLPAAYTCILA